MSRGRVSDAGRRLADAYALHRVADPHGSIGRWLAVRLSDGTGDGVLYDSKSAAVRHQHHNEDFYAFVQLTPATMTGRDADTFLALHRRMYDAGLRLADREARSGGRDMIRRLTRTDQHAQLRALFRGDQAPTNIIYQ